MLEVVINRAAPPREQTKMELRDRRCQFEWCLDVIETLNEMDARIEAYRREHVDSSRSSFAALIPNYNGLNVALAITLALLLLAHTPPVIVRIHLLLRRGLRYGVVAGKPPPSAADDEAERSAAGMKTVPPEETYPCTDKIGHE